MAGFVTRSTRPIRVLLVVPPNVWVVRRAHDGRADLQPNENGHRALDQGAPVPGGAPCKGRSRSGSNMRGNDLIQPSQDPPKRQPASKFLYSRRISRLCLPPMSCASIPRPEVLPSRRALLCPSPPRFGKNGEAWRAGWPAEAGFFLRQNQPKPQAFGSSAAMSCRCRALPQTQWPATGLVSVCRPRSPRKISRIVVCAFNRSIAGCRPTRVRRCVKLGVRVVKEFLRPDRHARERLSRNGSGPTIGSAYRIKTVAASCNLRGFSPGGTLPSSRRKRLVEPVFSIRLKGTGR